MNKIKLKVHWIDERDYDENDNNGKHFGIYIFDCLEKDFEGVMSYSDYVYGTYDILESIWFESEVIRDIFFDYVWEDLTKTDEYLLNNESITQDQRESLLELIFKLQEEYR